MLSIIPTTPSPHPSSRQALLVAGRACVDRRLPPLHSLFILWITVVNVHRGPRALLNNLHRLTPIPQTSSNRDLPTFRVVFRSRIQNVVTVKNLWTRPANDSTLHISIPLHIRTTQIM